MKFLKYLFRVVVGILALIGLIVVGLFCYLEITEKYSIILEQNDYDEDHYVELLKQSSFKADSVEYHFTTVRDPARAREIMDYFKLDTLYSPDATTWEKALAISKFVATNIPHDDPDENPEHPNAIDLWKYSREVKTGFNCRMHAILNYELMQAAGLTARYVTCLPKDRHDNDCHVVNEVWLPEQGKWAFIDADMGGNYITDQNGTPLNLLEMREKFVSGEQMLMHPGFKEATANHDYYYGYMAKNTYWFSCWETLHFSQEDCDDDDFGPCHYLVIVPEGFQAFGIDGNDLFTTDASRFWAPPQ